MCILPNSVNATVYVFWQAQIRVHSDDLVLLYTVWVMLLKWDRGSEFFTSSQLYFIPSFVLHGEFTRTIPLWLYFDFTLVISTKILHCIWFLLCFDVKSRCQTLKQQVSGFLVLGVAHRSYVFKLDKPRCYWVRVTFPRESYSDSASLWLSSGVTCYYSKVRTS